MAVVIDFANGLKLLNMSTCGSWRTMVAVEGLIVLLDD